MNNDKLKLLDGSEIEAISMYSLDSIVVLLEDVDGLQELKDKLTDDNLSAIEIYNGAGNKIGIYENLRLNGLAPQPVFQRGGGPQLCFCMQNRIYDHPVCQRDW